MPSNAEWSCLIWQALVMRATTRRTVTYGELDNDIGYGAPNLMGDQLRRIAAYCRAYQLPDLTVLVVNQDTGVPGVATVANVDREREHVFAVGWFRRLPPTLEDMTKA